MDSPMLSQEKGVGENCRLAVCVKILLYENTTGTTVCVKILLYENTTGTSYLAYSCQLVIIVYVVIFVCTVSSSLEYSQHMLWASLLSGSVGYILGYQAQKIYKRKATNILLLHEPAQRNIITIIR